MKSKLAKLFLACACLMGAFTFTKSVSKPYVESTKDSFNDFAGLKKVDVKRVAVGTSYDDTEVSPTYAQYGINSKGQYVLRFATAVRGDIESISYVRSIDSPYGEEKSVKDLYEGVLSGNEAVYYTGNPDDGNNGLSTDASYKGKYYWACYLIAFTSSEYHNVKVTAHLEVMKVGSGVAVVSSKRTASVNGEKDKNPTTPDTPDTPSTSDSSGSSESTSDSQTSGYDVIDISKLVGEYEGYFKVSSYEYSELIVNSDETFNLKYVGKYAGVGAYNLLYHKVNDDNSWTLSTKEIGADNATSIAIALKGGKLYVLWFKNTMGTVTEVNALFSPKA